MFAEARIPLGVMTQPVRFGCELRRRRRRAANGTRRRSFLVVARALRASSLRWRLLELCVGFGRFALLVLSSVATATSVIVRSILVTNLTATSQRERSVAMRAETKLTKHH